MDPLAQLQQELRIVQSRLAKAEAWIAVRKGQQLAHPFDEVSKDILGAMFDEGEITLDTTRNIALSGDPQTITVPVNPDGFRMVNLGGGTMANIAFYL